MGGIILVTMLLIVSCVKLGETGKTETKDDETSTSVTHFPEPSPVPTPREPSPSPIVPEPILSEPPTVPIVSNPSNPLPSEKKSKPKDPLVNYSWHLKNTGQKSFAEKAGTVGKDSKIIEANEEGYTGQGIRIAVSDTGMETSHEDLSGNVLAGEHRDYDLAKPWLGNPSTNDAHGTSVAGLIGAVGGNGLGSRGIAYGAKVAGFRYLGIKVSTLAKMIDQANGNFDIFNYSYGMPTCAYRDYYSSYIDQLKHGVTNLRGGKGSIYVKAAGNYWMSSLSDCDSSVDSLSLDWNDWYFGNSSLYATHSWPYLIVVGAFNADGKRAFYSSPGSIVWVSAPGGRMGESKPAMVTADLTGCSQGYSDSTKGVNDFDKGPVTGKKGDGDLNQKCQYTSTFNGTSAAASVVAGVVALILEANKQLSWRDVKYILAKTADQLDASLGDTDHTRKDRRLSGHTYLPSWVTNTAGFKFHNYYGFGGINAKTAVKMAESYSSFLGAFVETSWTDSNTISSSNTIPDASKEGLINVLNIQDDDNLTIEMVQIELSVTHPRISDIGVELTSPGGTKSVIIPINSNINGSNMNSWVLASNAFYGESSRGNWSIKLIDGLSGETGTLSRWKIKFFGY